MPSVVNPVFIGGLQDYMERTLDPATSVVELADHVQQAADLFNRQVGTQWGRQQPRYVHFDRELLADFARMEKPQADE